MSWMAVNPPLPPVNPTYAVLPVKDGMLMATDFVKVLPVLASVIVHVRVVPSYVMCTFITSPLRRLTPEPVVSLPGVAAGDCPLVHRPVRLTSLFPKAELYN